MSSCFNHHPIMIQDLDFISVSPFVTPHPRWAAETWSARSTAITWSLKGQILHHLGCFKCEMLWYLLDCCSILVSFSIAIFWLHWLTNEMCEHSMPGWPLLRYSRRQWWTMLRLNLHKSHQSSKIPTVPIYILAMLKWFSSEKKHVNSWLLEMIHGLVQDITLQSSNIV